jgi:hypothetical protein
MSSEFSVLSFELCPQRELSAEGWVETQKPELKTQHLDEEARPDMGE